VLRVAEEWCCESWHSSECLRAKLIFMSLVKAKAHCKGNPA
jgi:hypothetical protein